MSSDENPLEALSSLWSRRSRRSEAGGTGGDLARPNRGLAPDWLMITTLLNISGLSSSGLANACRYSGLQEQVYAKMVITMCEDQGATL